MHTTFNDIFCDNRTLICFSQETKSRKVLIMSVANYVMLTVAAALLLFSFPYSTEGKGRTRNKIAELNDPLVRRSPLFCLLKHMDCMNGHHSEERSKYYMPTRRGCEARLKRRYFCSERSMRREMTNEERRKYYITSRSAAGVNGEDGHSEPEDAQPQNGSSNAELARMTSLHIIAVHSLHLLNKRASS